MALEVTRGVLAALRDYASRTHPNEACGLLFGEERVERAVACANVHPQPETQFEIDPQALIAAHKAARSGGPAIAGYWHSHPVGSVVPSATDQAQASGDGRVWAIVAGDEIGFWRDAPDGFEPLSYCWIDG